MHEYIESCSKHSNRLVYTHGMSSCAAFVRQNELCTSSVSSLTHLLLSRTKKGWSYSTGSGHSPGILPRTISPHCSNHRHLRLQQFWRRLGFVLLLIILQELSLSCYAIMSIHSLWKIVQTAQTQNTNGVPQQQEGSVDCCQPVSACCTSALSLWPRAGGHAVIELLLLLLLLSVY